VDLRTGQSAVLNQKGGRDATLLMLKARMIFAIVSGWMFAQESGETCLLVGRATYDLKCNFTENVVNDLQRNQVGDFSKGSAWE
jgi:hypothetical protein